MSRTCSRCGSHIPEGHVICPTCGAPVPKSSQYVRCSHCHRRVPAHLAVCPHCGRELKPWRVDKWVAVISLLFLFGLWLFFGNGLHVLGETRSALAALLPPRITPVTQEVASVATATPTMIPATATPVIPTATLAPVDTPIVEPTATATTTSEQPATATETPTPTTTPTPTPKPQPDVYVVKAGDTLSGIAEQVDRTVAALAAYNKIKDPTSIRVGQELRIPPADYTPPTPTPKRPTKTPTPRPTATPSITLAAPALLSPGDTTPFHGQDALIELVWQALPTGIPAGAEYVVRIGVKVGENQVDWRLTEPTGNSTHYRVPAWLFGQAPQQFGRAYVWYVQVGRVTRDGDDVQIIPISHPSEHRVFYWN